LGQNYSPLNPTIISPPPPKKNKTKKPGPLGGGGGACPRCSQAEEGVDIRHESNN